MRRGVAVVAIVFVAIGVIYWFQHSGKQLPSTPVESAVPAPSSAPAPGTPAPNQAPSSVPSNPQVAVTNIPSAADAGTTNLAARAGAIPPPAAAPDLPPDVVLGKVSHAIHQYQALFGGNPVGVNSEITSALNGHNPKQLNFIDPQDGMQINANGELVDAWGTPFFFHQLSGKDMEIRSAGPDKKMWTVDDLVTR